MTLRMLTLTVAALVVTVFYFYNDPATHKNMIQCSIRQIWGVHCWGCGGQSAFHQFLHGNWLQSLKHNALVFPFILLFAFVYSGELSGRSDIFYKFLRRRWVWISVLIGILMFTLARNIVPYGWLRL